MLTYSECKEIALSKAQEFGIELDKAYILGKGFVFESSKEECVGLFPIVVKKSDGECTGLWSYINKNNLSMDNMRECAF